MWKDWRGTPEVRFPSAERASLSPPSFAAPTSLSDQVPRPSIEPPAASPPKSTQPESAAPKTTEQTASASAPSTASSPAPATLPVASITHPVASGPVSAASTTAPSASAAVPPTEPVPTGLAKTERAPAPAISEKPGDWAPLEKSTPAAKTEKATTGERPSLPVSSIPKTKPAAVAAPLEAYIAPAKLGKDAGKRKGGDDLISDLFEACGDLQFLRDSLEGADFVATLALEKMPSELCLVSLFDINRRELVIVRQAGGPKSIVLKRLSERSGVVTAAMRKRAAIVIPDAKKDPRAVDDRYQQLGLEPKSMIVAPVEQSGRYLGIIELVNPADGKPFTEAEGHALTYIGEQYAELVATHGIQIEPDLVIERHQRR
ncbi:MAG: GAF domain-containing protein [Polyangiaceae bacterium]|nr:GAF domain-containing protein [Polyangiaceae bacterium]